MSAEAANTYPAQSTAARALVDDAAIQMEQDRLMALMLQAEEDVRPLRCNPCVFFNYRIGTEANTSFLLVCLLPSTLKSIMI
jgi:hypothetical protein